ncbi:hypothetical protein [Ligilactobacillus salivarius]|uniref:Uncharacterized protein n=1 Tax=Ligilactobacillus salivarius TaxID=1624 RepID=A0A1V9RBP2_9LACO|nr:hypothetical protein [Ligilactobacillus salivarius]OQQ90570.1 hypothetical protein B6U56_04605 [Ligilactobacillus salivarius]
MNELKNMTKEELIDELESKGICIVLDNNLDDYTDYLNDIYEAFNEIVDDIEENYFNEPTNEQLQESWIARVRAGLDEENYFNEPTNEQLQESWIARVRAGLDEEDFEEELAREFYYEDCILNELSIGNARKFLRWLDDKSRFFTYVDLKSGKKSVDLVEYHPCTNLESYLLEDKQALESVFFGK